MTKAKKRLGRPALAFSEDTRERILAAARKCFVLNGYDKTTNKDIAEAAGLTSGALYHYFPSKRHLFIALVVAQTDIASSAYNEAMNSTEGAVAKLCAVLDRAAILIREDEFLARFTSIASIELDRHKDFLPLLEKMTEESHLPRSGAVRDVYAKVVADGQRTGEINPDIDGNAVVDMLMSFSHGLAIILWHGSPKSDNYIGAIEALKRLLQAQLTRSL